MTMQLDKFLKNMALSACNICGSTAFRDGPGGRRFNGIPPTCEKCGSLERHRALRSIFNRLDTSLFTDLIALQFSLDPSIDEKWFRRCDRSIYGKRNSYDLQKIPLPVGAYDVVVCNHVIEHVEDDRAAFTELCRITSARGFAFVSVPNPAERQKTADWGYPNPEDHGHYRVYGADIVDRIKAYLPDTWCVMIKDTDPVTRREDIGFILSKARLWHDLPIRLGMRAKSVNKVAA